MRPQKHSAVRYGLALMLALCSLSSHSAEPANAVHAALTGIRDAALKSCIAQHQQKHQWRHLAQVTQLKCHNRGIVSLEGLAAFSALTRASFFNNAITHYTPTGLSQLKHLNLAKNPLRSLALTHTTLEELYIFSTNLQTLTLSLPTATIVRANNNQLTQFTYRHLTQLKKLYLFDNALKALDITRLPQLHFMDVRQNPMPDELYDAMDQLPQATVLHDGNAEDWQ